MSEGLSEGEACERAIATLGNIRDVYLSRRPRPRAWNKTLLTGIMLLVLASVINHIWFLSRIPNDHLKFAQHGGGERAGFNTTMVATDYIRIEYSVRYQRGKLSYAVYDSQGGLIWQRDFLRADFGEEIVPVVNKGQAVVVARGSARNGGIKFRIYGVHED